MGIGRLFLLTAGSGWAVAVCAAAEGAGGGTGTGRLFFTEGMLPACWLRMPRATLSMSPTVVFMASAISLLVTETKWGSFAREARPPSTRAWGNNIMKWEMVREIK